MGGDQEHAASGHRCVCMCVGGHVQVVLGGAANGCAVGQVRVRGVTGRGGLPRGGSLLTTPSLNFGGGFDCVWGGLCG